MTKLWLVPVSFTRWPVTIILTAVYVAVVAMLLVVEHVTPAAPTSPDHWMGMNITQAWADLQLLTRQYHPYNSHANDNVRQALLRRINEILEKNGASHSVIRSDLHAPIERTRKTGSNHRAVVFDDLSSNASFAPSATGKYSAYFEGSNILVYVAGSNDDAADWWNTSTKLPPKYPSHGKYGVLVNAHYDSVSTGFGATDDGVGVATLLQLIDYYSQHQPKRGILMLFNNGEEDYLNGARAMLSHPMSRFPKTFVNLEGAGAGGRAAIFRSTDADVTYAYQTSPHPYGTSVAADAFKQGLVRSQTDYIVFDDNLGMRGVDIAFTQPRSRYHTAQDSTVYTSLNSVYHMLSAAIATTKSLTEDLETKYESSHGVDAVFFDIFGSSFAVLPLTAMFGISIALLVLGPVVLTAVIYVLISNDRWYLFMRHVKSDPFDPHAPDEEITVDFEGWRGFFRFPIGAGISLAAIAALAFLVTGTNPYIVYSSPYAVWTMTLSAVLYIDWFFLRGASYMRPSALQRAHGLGWVYAITWVLLVGATVAANQRGIASGYPIMLYNASAFVALLLSYLEFFYLPSKGEYVRHVTHKQVESAHGALSSAPSGRQSRDSDDSSRRPRATSAGQAPSETTSLLGRDRDRQSAWRGSHSRNPSGTDHEPELSSVPLLSPAFEHEQEWSGSLPSWLWVLQFLSFSISIIILGQIGLFTSSALSQTLADGSPAFTVYLAIAVLSWLILLPAAPFIHRITSRVPNFVLLVMIGCLVYCLVAFPFSHQNRLKVFFTQNIDLDTGENNATLRGLPGYVQQVVSELPSAAGQNITCSAAKDATGPIPQTCSWRGITPSVVNASHHRYHAINTTSWITVEARRLSKSSLTAQFKLSGQNTRACRIEFDSPLADFNVSGAGEQDTRLLKIPDEGAYELRLWSRQWENEWSVTTRWKENPSSTRGRVSCLWSDQNVAGAIPALDEIQHYIPSWAIVTKADDGLVRGFKTFQL